jgi:thiosulfate dehydrogenase
VRNYLKNGIADPNNPQARLHNFGTGQPGLTDNQIEALVLFLFNGGLIDTSEYIFDGPFSKATKGDAARGLTLYNSGNANGASCGSVSCHGPNGDTILFDGGEESLGSLALDNPWEVLHKARFGQPGAPQMISVMQWGSNDDAGDIVAYTQTLPPPPLQ